MNVEQEISSAIISVVRSHSFYGHIITQLSRVYTSHPSVPTLGVGKDRKEDYCLKLYVNPDYVNRCYTEHRSEKAFTHFVEVVKHQVLHIVFGHLTYDMPDKRRERCAQELAVNSYLDRTKLLPQKDGSPGGVFPEDYNLESKQSFIWYYNQLEKNEKFNKNPEKSDGNMDQHQMWEQIDGDIDNEMIKDIVRKSAETCKKDGRWGNVPSEVMERVDQLNRYEPPAVPLSSVVRQFTAYNIDNKIKFTMRKKSRRFGTRPGIVQTYRLNIGIGIDTSGSVSRDTISFVHKELYWLHKGGSKITIFESDTIIQRVYDYSQWDGYVKGRGGTDLEPVIKRVSEEKYDCLIYFTDFQAPKIANDYHLPILWILSDTNVSKEQYPYPHGLFIRVDHNMNCTVER